MTTLTRANFHHFIYICSLITIAIALPLSIYVLSVGGIILVVNACAEWNWKERWNRLKQNKLAIILSSFALLFCLGLFKTDNWSSALDLVIMKGPILFAPLIIASSAPIQKKQLNLILHCFLLSVLFTTIYSFIYFIIYKNQIADIREISLFISHIRFSLLIDLAIVFAIYYFYHPPFQKKYLKYIYLIFTLWLLFYLFIAQTLTGIIILMIIVIIFCIYQLHKSFKRKTSSAKKRWVLPSLILLLFFLLAGDIIYLTIHYFQDNEGEKTLETTTLNGNPYYHDTESIIENGSHIYYYVCYDELKTEWAKRSKTPYTQVEPALIRYLNSMGLRKDSVGVSKLQEKDIENIERGIANIYYTQPFGLKKSLYPTFFGINLYRKYHQIENSSLLQRVELWHYSWLLITEHPIFGVGVGDEKQELDIILSDHNSPLKNRKNMGCHNQFLTLWLSGGIIVLIGFILVLFIPFFTKGKSSILYLLFFTILFLSMFMEDTINTSTGIYFYAFFNALLLFGREEPMSKQSDIT